MGQRGNWDISSPCSEGHCEVVTVGTRVTQGPEGHAPSPWPSPRTSCGTLFLWVTVTAKHRRCARPHAKFRGSTGKRLGGSPRSRCSKSPGGTLGVGPQDPAARLAGGLRHRAFLHGGPSAWLSRHTAVLVTPAEIWKPSVTCGLLALTRELAKSCSPVTSQSTPTTPATLASPRNTYDPVLRGSCLAWPVAPGWWLAHALIGICTVEVRYIHSHPFRLCPPCPPPPPTSQALPLLRYGHFLVSPGQVSGFILLTST